MHYEEFAPSPAIRDHVLRFWHFDAGTVGPGAHGHRVLPDGCIGLVFTLRASQTASVVLQGAFGEALVVPVHTGDRFWGIRFWPDAGGACLNMDPRDLAGTRGPAAERLGTQIDALGASVAAAPSAQAVIELLEGWCAARVHAAAMLDAATRLTLLAIVAGRGGLPIGELAAVVGLSARQLQRRFLAATGLTLKQYSRIRRLRESTGHLLANHPVTWSAVAAELGFSDHAHLTREFTALAGATPTEVAQYVVNISHGQVHA